MPKKREYWTIVHGDRIPVKPFDCNTGSRDEGMLVYRSKRAAMSACSHQFKTWDIRCQPCRLGEEK